MKITLVTHSDSRGGAAVVTLRLAHALRDCGVDVVVLAANVSADDPVVRPLASSTAVHMAFLAEHIDIFRHRGVRRDNLFKISTATAGLPLWQHPDIADADVVVLGWVNQGTVSLRGIQRLHAAFPDKHILWVMHDLWNATGICHHTVDGCDRLTGVCGACPLLHGRPHATDLSTRTQAAKKALYEAVPIRFVAVSNWLAERCRESSLMRDADISVVPNALDALRMPHLALGRVGMEMLPLLYRRADIVLSTSRHETLPGTLIEGIACGARAVTTSHGGQSDIVTDTSLGSLCPDDPKAIASAIDAQLAERASCRDIAADRAAMHTAIADRFAASAIADRFLSLLTSRPQQ